MQRGISTIAAPFTARLYGAHQYRTEEYMSIHRSKVLLAFVAMLAPALAHAQAMPDCDTGLSAPPIYISGSTALEPLIKALGKQLASSTDAATKYSLVYLGDGSCVGVRKFVPFGSRACTTVLS